MQPTAQLNPLTNTLPPNPANINQNINPTPPTPIPAQITPNQAQTLQPTNTSITQPTNTSSSSQTHNPDPVPITQSPPCPP